MKKFLFTLLLFISLFLNIYKVEADVVMYRECSGNYPAQAIVRYDGDDYFYVNSTDRFPLSKVKICNGGCQLGNWEIGSSSLNYQEKCPADYVERWLIVYEKYYYGVEAATSVEKLSDYSYTVFKLPVFNTVGYVYYGKTNGRYFTNFSNDGFFESNNIRYYAENKPSLKYWEIGSASTIYYDYMEEPNYLINDISIYPLSSSSSDLLVGQIEPLFNSDSLQYKLEDAALEWYKGYAEAAGVNGFKKLEEVFEDANSEYSAALSDCNEIIKNKKFDGTDKEALALITKVQGMEQVMNDIYDSSSGYNENNYDVTLLDNGFVPIMKKLGISDPNDFFDSTLKLYIKEELRDILSKGFNDSANGEYSEMEEKLSSCMTIISKSEQVSDSTKKKSKNIAERTEKKASEFEQLTLSSDDYVGPASCEELIGADIIRLLSEYVGWIRVLVPVVLIVLGMIDLSGAVIASNEDTMKKAQKKFINRIIVAVAIFLLPLFIELILDVFSDYYAEITYSDCGIF